MKISLLGNFETGQAAHYREGLRDIWVGVFVHVDLHVNHEDFFCSTQQRTYSSFELNKGLPVEILDVFFSLFEWLSENCFLNKAVFHKVIK